MMFTCHRYIELFSVKGRTREKGFLNMFGVHSIFGLILRKKINILLIDFKSLFWFFLELFGDGGCIFLPLVWWVWRSQNFRTNCLPTMSKGYEHFWSQIFHGFFRFIRIGKNWNFCNLNVNFMLELYSTFDFRYLAQLWLISWYWSNWIKSL